MPAVGRNPKAGLPPIKSKREPTKESMVEVSRASIKFQIHLLQKVGKNLPVDTIAKIMDDASRSGEGRSRGTELSSITWTGSGTETLGGNSGVLGISDDAEVAGSVADSGVSFSGSVDRNSTDRGLHLGVTEGIICDGQKHPLLAKFLLCETGWKP